MSEIYHLVIEKGPETGRKINVPPEGARLGRSSKNDIVIEDPLLSRHHCRLFFKTGGGLWITDLGSANECFVNAKIVSESALQVGDLITVGETGLRVMDNGLAPANQKAAAPGAQGSQPPVDLGLRKDDELPACKKIGFGPLLVIGCVAVLIVLLVCLPKLLKEKPGKTAPLPPAPPSALEVAYEKVEATTSNIFYYSLVITKGNKVSVQIDNLAHTNHIKPPEKLVEPTVIASLTKSLQESGFFDLAEEYKGIQPDILEQYDLSITIGTKTHRTVVVNRVLPDAFDSATKTLEVFAKNELGIWSSDLPPEKLTEMARNAVQQGRKLYEEKNIKYDNLAAALKSFLEAEGYLENVEPKPDFYAEIISSIKDCKQELQTKYDDSNFRIEQATKTKDWETAARELKILLETITDRSDPRNQDARKKLVLVESHLKVR
jgi:hypothetical protein